ncbi:MAG: LD-carboxypeptidase [Bacteroidales bacterium]|nr:LD-carboxypeptidase [Bacteroidales bacterium]
MTKIFNPLKKGDIINIVSPAGKIAPEILKKAVYNLEDYGFKVRVSEHVLSEYHQFAGTDENRIKDFQKAIDDDSACILCARGGYGSIRIIDKLDFSNFKKKQKLLIGFSDISIFHAVLNNLGIASIHGNMLKGLNNMNSKSSQKLLKAMMGKNLEYSIENCSLNRKGEVETSIIGGNLSILYSLLGTPYFPNTKGKILFIEDLNEQLYHLDRMMHSLKFSGVLENLAGLIVGAFFDMKNGSSPFGKTANEIIAEHVSDYSYPVCFNFPAGHIDDNNPIIFGKSTKFSVKTNCSKLGFYNYLSVFSL